MENIKTVYDYRALKPVKPTHRIYYGEHEEQFGELYLPPYKDQQTEDTCHSIIILLHGGCWRSEIDLSGLGPLCVSLSQLGYAVWNLEYRRLDNGGGWPMTFEDVALGADFLSQIADKYSLDLSRVISMGHSAGGHLALWLAARKKLSSESILYNPNPLSINSVISLAGIPDLEQAADQKICRGHIEQLMKGMPSEVIEYYQQVSINHFEPLDIRITHLIGEYDQVVPVDYLKEYSRKQLNSLNKLTIIPNIGHFEMVMPAAISWGFIKETLIRHT